MFPALKSATKSCTIQRNDSRHKSETFSILTLIDQLAKMDIEKIERRSLSAEKKKRAQKDGSGQVRKIEAGLVIAGHRYFFSSDEF